MHRRTLLVAVGTAVLTAGCGSESDGPATADEGTVTMDDRTARTDVTTETGDRPTPNPTSSVAPDESSTPTATSTFTPSLGPADFRDAFVAAIEGNGATVDSLAVSAEIVQLDYVTGRSSAEEVSAEIGMIAGRFFDQVDRGWDVERLEATLVDGDGSPQATWFADADWLARYHDGEITAEELTTRVLETLEAVE